VFADIRVQVPGQKHYFIEIKYGYSGSEILECLTRKYRTGYPEPGETTKVILVADNSCFDDREAFSQQLQAALGDSLELELWDEAFLRAEIAHLFGVELERITEDTVEELRVALENAKGRSAFGEEWSGDLVQSSLMWHLGFWRIKQLRDQGEDLSAVLQAGPYPEVAVLLADLSCFGSYVRDTRDSEVIHAALTSFYTKSRYEILNSGGLLYQIMGDQVTALYGVPDRSGDYLQAALDCAHSLANVGNSVSMEWQRQIDRTQTSAGVHIGMALGDIEVVRMRPFARVRFGLVGDCINIALCLRAAAKSGEAVVNNDYFRRLDANSRERFQEIAALNTKNVGKVRAFKTTF
jgi:class 3 adenylate cyclase